ncbi:MULTISPECIES: bifunctional 2-methylcitrate synthase/citrate synthase [unclassified Frigoribacterium]|uniref:bifunctional 2-methylcitrate synthase/citrate synthase n=1 Tax=unclassified Frigoribacterium TaxID=2627005 RepID=UPI0006FDA90F|nr:MULTISPECIES: bifunctional 2-methylcitrate synthase/citrate synthase [unclassified Frigoribacterium]KQO84669.1 citrate synthase [Frigoribacterium sp. Leaf263]KQR66790.1 citrate synthase [Frigoribacterium sp. Leaf172]
MTDTITSPPPVELHKGLAGVVVDRTAVSKVDAASNSLLYRGYPVQQLAAERDIEDVAHLLIHGELPTAEQRAAFDAELRAARPLAPGLLHVIDLIPTSAHPMDVVRTAVSALGAAQPEPSTAPGEYDADATRRIATRLFAVLPAVIAYDQRRRHDLPPVPPRDDLGYSADFLHQVFGREADPLDVRAFDTSMVLYAEHSFNASTFTARVIASTLSDLHSSIVGAIGALKGPLHGGANEAALELLARVTDAGGAEGAGEWLDGAFARREKIMGFGHRVYKNGDSRVPTMEQALAGLVDRARASGDARIADLAATYDVLAAGVLEKKGLKPNVDYPSGLAYHLMGFDTAVFTPLFVASRVLGWSAHVIEQREANSLIRPLSHYDGAELRDVPPRAEGAAPA